MEKYLLKGHLASIVNYTFQTLLVTYLILLLAEQIQKGFILNYLNLNYLLALVILLGILDVFSEHSFISSTKPTWKDYSFITILGMAGFIIIKFKTEQLGWLSLVISIIAGILIILLSILVLEDNENEQTE
ncbi:hypothetical protein HYW74_04225 [Candidatus Pacearchaeota archaeon]|nr:hypothetical protein [Candidatus Pacearchaeota archaeon]